MEFPVEIPNSKIFDGLEILLRNSLFAKLKKRRLLRPTTFVYSYIFSATQDGQIRLSILS
ncbi:hypothetical protein SDJN02_24682, partial [Cucurbita argyrosperma subsp. argyrosperma]